MTKWSQPKGVDGRLLKAMNYTGCFTSTVATNRHFVRSRKRLANESDFNMIDFVPATYHHTQRGPWYMLPTMLSPTRRRGLSYIKPPFSFGFFGQDQPLTGKWFLTFGG